MQTKYLLSVVRVLLLACSVVALTACETLLPADPRSLDVAGERVTVEFLTYNQLAELSKSKELGWVSGEPLFNVEEEKAYAAPAVGALAASAIGYAIDFTVKQLKAEALRYTANYSGAASTAKFWSQLGDPYTGFVLRRETKAHKGLASAACVLIGRFELLDAEAPRNGQYVVKPVYLRLSSAKAKVLKRRWWAIPSWFSRTSNEVDVDVALSLRASWQKDGVLRNEEFATLTLPTIKYDLDAERASPDSLRKSTAFGFLGMPRPRSDSDDKTKIAAEVAKHPFASADAALTLKLVVTERDSANAGEKIDQAATLLANRKQDIIQWVIPSGRRDDDRPAEPAPPGGGGGGHGGGGHGGGGHGGGGNPGGGQ